MTVTSVRPGIGPEGYMPPMASPEQLKILHATVLGLYNGIMQESVWLKGAGIDAEGTVTIPLPGGLRNVGATESSDNGPYLRMWRPDSTVRIELGEPGKTDYRPGLFTHNVLANELTIDGFSAAPTGTRNQYEVVVEAYETDDDNPRQRRHVRQETGRTHVGVDAPLSLADFSRGLTICSNLDSKGRRAAQVMRERRFRPSLGARFLGALGLR